MNDGVELVEGAAGRVHLGVVLPRLGDHHQHRVRQRRGRRGAAARAPRRSVAESLTRSGVQIGKSRSRSPGITSLASCASRARIQLRLPLTVLISPLCAISRNGCASGQLGKVLVENRECTSASAVANRSSDRSGKNGSQLAGGEHALVDQGARGQRREVRRRPRARRACAGRRPCRSQRQCRRRPAAGRAATNSCAKRGMARAGGGADAGRASTGTSRQPRTVRPSSAAIRSTRPTASAALGVVGRAGRRCRRRTRAAGGSSKSTTCAQERVGDLGEDPAPSPESGSAPAAPRWSRLRSAVSACGDDVVAWRPRERRPRRRRRRRRARGAVVEPTAWAGRRRRRGLPVVDRPSARSGRGRKVAAGTPWPRGSDMITARRRADPVRPSRLVAPRPRRPGAWRGRERSGRRPAATRRRVAAEASGVDAAIGCR